VRRQAPEPEQYQEYQDQPAPAPKRAKRGGGWKIVVQFIVGLAVIAGVAAAIVWLYIKYYQQ
jgi:hypothetical protein